MGKLEDPDTGARTSIIKTYCHGVKYGSIIIIVHFNEPISAPELADARARLQDAVRAGTIVAAGLRPSKVSVPAVATTIPANATANVPPPTGDPLSNASVINGTALGSESNVMSAIFPDLTTRAGYIMLVGIIMAVLIVTGVFMGFILKDGHVSVGHEHHGVALARSTIVTEKYGQNTSITPIKSHHHAHQRKYTADLEDWNRSRYEYGHQGAGDHSSILQQRGINRNTDRMSTHYMDPTQPTLGQGSSPWQNVGPMTSPASQMYDEYLTLDGQPLMSPIGAAGMSPYGQYRNPSAAARLRVGDGARGSYSYAQAAPVFQGGASLGLAGVGSSYTDAQDGDYFAQALQNNPMASHPIALNVSPEVVDSSGAVFFDANAAADADNESASSIMMSPTNPDRTMGTPRSKSALGRILTNPSAVVAGGLHGTVSAKQGKGNAARAAAATAWAGDGGAAGGAGGAITPDSNSSASSSEDGFGFGDGGQESASKTDQTPQSRPMGSRTPGFPGHNQLEADVLQANLSAFNLGGVTWDDVPEAAAGNAPGGAEYRAVAGQKSDLTPMKQHYYPNTSSGTPAAFVAPF